MKSPDDPVTDLDVVFLAIYNLLYEKIEKEPNKGIVVSKGNPNQRKATWKEVMRIAHTLEDFFVLRDMRTGGKECCLCKYWESVSTESPHLGKCKRYKQGSLHAFNSCKRFKRGSE